MCDDSIKYPNMNEKLNEEETATFVELLVRMVRWSEGGINGVLFFVNRDTGEQMQIHIDAHDAVMCEMEHLKNLDNTVGSTVQ
jgi:hypothetical protein